MRLLFTFAGGSGHLEPLVPVARAARAAGHTVLQGSSYRRTAEGIRDEFVALPGPVYAVTLLERLGTG